MGASPPPKIACTFCGKQYLWKPKLAGRPIQCACGQIFQAPDSPPSTQQLDLLAEIARRWTPPPRSGGSPLPASEMPADPQPDAKPPASRPTIPHIGIARYQEPDKSDQLKRIILIASGLALLIALIFAVPHLISRHTTPTPPALGDDARVNELIDNYGRIEARDWLDPSAHHDIVGAIWSREHALTHINQWYDSGAKSVLAYGGMAIRCLVIELPDEPAKRKTFFDFAEDWRRTHHADQPAMRDVGQKFIVIDFL